MAPLSRYLCQSLAQLSCFHGDCFGWMLFIYYQLGYGQHSPMPEGFLVDEQDGSEKLFLLVILFQIAMIICLDYDLCYDLIPCRSNCVRPCLFLGH